MHMNPVSTLLGLAADRPMRTTELHEVNAYYGHDAVVKRFLGLHPAYALKAMLVHAPGLEFHIWEVEEHSPLPFLLCASEKYAAFFNARNRGGKKAFPVGPMLAYLPPETPPEKDGERTLLIFPKHSTHHIHVQYDAEAHVARMAPVWKEFDRVVACLYWKDVLLGRHEAYRAAGFECVTAGHMFDPLFLYRLRAIIRRADLVVSGFPGTDVIYSTLLGKPVWVRQYASSVSYTDGRIREGHKEMLDSGNALRERGPALFDRPLDAPSAEQTAFIEDIVGMGSVKTPGELMDIAAAAELRFCKAHGLPFRGLPAAGEGA